MKLYLGSALSSGRSHWMAEETGEPCEIVRAGAPTAAANSANPPGTSALGALPLLADDGAEIGQWPAIVMYLADRFPQRRLAPDPTSAERARYYAAISLVATKADPIFSKIKINTRWGPVPRREAILDDESRHQLGELAAALVELLGEQEYVVGGRFTAADVAVGSVAAWFDFLGVLSAHPALVAYKARIEARPAYQRTLGDLISKVRKPPNVPPLARLREGKAGAPLFFFGRPNMGPDRLAALDAKLVTDRPFYLLQFAYPEEPDLGRPFTHEEYTAWARNFIEAMRSVQPKGPYLLIGVCEGMQIAYEAARLLEADGEELALLASVDTWPPEDTRIPILANVRRAENALRALLATPPQERVRLLGLKLRRALDRTVARAGKKLGVERARPSAPLKAPDHVEAWQRWQERAHPTAAPSRAPIRAKITVFRATKQFYWLKRDPELAWGSRTHGGVEVYTIEGEHRLILNEPFLEGLGQRLSDCLLQIDASMARRERRADPQASEGARS